MCKNYMLCSAKVTLRILSIRIAPGSTVDLVWLNTGNFLLKFSTNHYSNASVSHALFFCLFVYLEKKAHYAVSSN